MEKSQKKDFVLEDHLACCPPDAITIMDRWYEDYSIFAAHDAAGIHFITRAKLGGNFKQVGIFLQSGKQEDIVDIKDASVPESPGSATQLARKTSSSLSEGHITEWGSRSLNYFPLQIKPVFLQKTSAGCINNVGVSKPRLIF